ncbi:UDP-N-acetylmuramoyl-L-alanine--D-glutamate ligase [Candidatus Nomurabacteria bacterium]|nr:UDP-N-acetylmuramoyl-L-alanine--D-glutamate ligase [Candidatus Nomurabacteria bacterium]
MKNKMQNFREFFKNKKVTVVGLGLLGKRLGDIAFLAENGAKVLVTDLKTEKELAPSIKKLKKYNLPRNGRGNITYVLGEHRLEDFDSCDFVLKGQGVPLDSRYIKYADSKGIPIEMDESLFAKLAPKVKIIGVTGTRGKSTTTILIYEILKASGMRVHLGGNIKGTAALPLLNVVKDWDVVVFELSSWQLQGFGEAKISPNISVFTNFMPDHMNYYKDNLKEYLKDKSYIYKFQKKPARNAAHSAAGGDNVLVLGPSLKGKIRDIKGKLLTANIKNIPKTWKIKLKGKHNLENIACAIEVARVLKVKEEIIRKTVENFKAVSGRLELVKTVKGIEIYNDTNSCTPEATSVALQALGSKNKNIVLIMGGSDKNLDFKSLLKDIKKYAKAVVLLPGNGTNRIIKDLKKTKVSVYEEKNLKDAIEKSLGLASRQDILLFSPAFASFNMFKNEYDRGEQFMKIIKSLK